jgi:hypothetical protein
LVSTGSAIYQVFEIPYFSNINPGCSYVISASTSPSVDLPHASLEVVDNGPTLNSHYVRREVTDGNLYDY